ncbi:MAG: methionine--tRNA ligase, partial [Methanobacteriota archaeon]
DGMKDEHGSDEMDEAPEGTTWLDYSTFTQMELRTGRIESVEDHPDADNLYVIHVDDGSADGRTLCAGLKPFYSKDGMAGMTIVFVANLEPRKLRGILSEGMLLAAEDDDGNVRLVTVDGDISPGSSVH